MVIRQGNIFWVDLGNPEEPGPGYRHPHLVIQNDIFNASRIQTTVVCALTSNLERAKAPGIVILKKGEASMPKKCVVNVSRIYTVDKVDLIEKIGSLSTKRFDEVLKGIQLLIEPRQV